MDVRELRIKWKISIGEGKVLFDGMYVSERRKRLLIYDRLWLEESKGRLKVEDYWKWLILGGRW